MSAFTALSVALCLLPVFACQRASSDVAAEKLPPTGSVGLAVSVQASTPLGGSATVVPQASRLTPSAEPVVAAPAALEHVAFTLGGTADEPLPWIVALHGLGDTPENFSALLRAAPLRAHVYAPRAPHPYGDGYDWFQAHVSGDPVRLTRGIEAALSQLLSWLDSMERSEATLGKPLLVGFSQGGILSFALLTRAPEKVALAVPIGGMLPKALWPSAKTPGAGRLIALHGSVDPAIPLGPTRALTEQFKRQGFDVQLEAFPGVGHRIPTAVRERLFEVLAEALPR